MNDTHTLLARLARLARLGALLGALGGALVLAGPTAVVPPPAGAAPAQPALASGQWQVSLSWFGTVSYASDTLQSRTRFLGNGMGTLTVGGDTVTGPYTVVALVGGEGRARSVRGAEATGGTSDGTWSFDGDFAGSATRPCLTGTLSLGGTFEYQDDDGLLVFPLDGIAVPMTCDDWPVRLTSVRCNVFEGEWAWARTAGLTTVGFRFDGSPSRIWGVRAPRSARGAQASADAMRNLTAEIEALTATSPASAADLRAFLRSARSRLPQVAPACGGTQTDVALAVLTRVLVANVLDQGPAVPADVVVELADVAARVDAFARPRSDLATTTLERLDGALRALATDPELTAGQRRTAADAARALGLTETARILTPAGASR